MPLKALHHHDNPYVWCGTSLPACEACDHKCMGVEALRFVWTLGVKGDDPDHYHNDPMKPSVTGMLACPRQAALMATMDYAESPKALWKRAFGTMAHRALEAANDDGQSEVLLEYPLSGGGVLTGSSDRVTDEFIMDYKTMRDIRKTIDHQNHEQVSCYKDMDDYRRQQAGLPYLADRKLLIAQVAQAGYNIIEAEYQEGALPKACERAEAYLAVIRGEAPMLSLPPDGRFMKYQRNTRCDYCPAEIRTACEEMDPPGGE